MHDNLSLPLSLLLLLLLLWIRDMSVNTGLALVSRYVSEHSRASRG